MKKLLRTLLFVVFLFFSNVESYTQIEAIQGLAEGAGSLISDISPVLVEAGCNSMNCCWDGGLFFIDFLIEHQREIMNLRKLDPTLISLEIGANFAYALHYSQGDMYNYINYLPQIRGNLGIFSTDFRYNILMEYLADGTDSFNSWELVFMLNFVPDETFKMSFGSGMCYEIYTDTYYNEHYFGTKIGLFQNRDFIDIDTRLVVDYARGIYPFFEAGVRYNTKMIKFEHLSAYISLGGIYQNYYQAHDIWAARGGLIFNIY